METQSWYPGSSSPLFPLTLCPPQLLSSLQRHVSDRSQETLHPWYSLRSPLASVTSITSGLQRSLSGWAQLQECFRHRLVASLSSVHAPCAHSSPSVLSHRCGGHLFMLCQFALRAYDEHHLYHLDTLRAHREKYHNPAIRHIFSPSSPRPVTGDTRGVLVDYETIPGVLLSLLYPLWGLTPPQARSYFRQSPTNPSTSEAILSFSLPSLTALSATRGSTLLATSTALTPQTLRAMKEQSLIYSKTGNHLASSSTGRFQQDSQTKDLWANDEINAMSEAILEGSYQTLRAHGERDLSTLLDKYILFERVSSQTSNVGERVPAAELVTVLPTGRELVTNEALKSIPLPEVRLEGGEELMKAQLGVSDGEELIWTTPEVFETKYHSDPYEVTPLSHLLLLTLSA
jgi:hypothetical protein